MNPKFTVDKEVQKTFDALDNLNRVDGNPYLFTRIQAQLEREQEGEKHKIWHPSTILTWSLVILLLAINVFAIRENFNTETDSSSLVEAITSDYGLDTSEEDYLNQN